MNLAGRVQMFVFLRILFTIQLGGSSIYSLKGKNNDNNDNDNNNNDKNNK